MPSPSSLAELLDLIRKSGVVEEKRLTAYVEKLRAANALPTEPNRLAGQMVVDGLLTTFQAEQFLMGKWRRFSVGKYKVLERLGSGGMGSVYLCEHKLMRRRVAVKILPVTKAEDPAALERFYREARAVAALDHPNIVRAYDIDQDEKLHFLVMEHVDGANLQEIVKRTGPMDVLRACHYMRQAALGLQHAFETAGLVHRDIKPGNILVDRNGIVKILDMGLARFFHDEDDVLTKKYDENVLGTADYLAPEQAIDSHGVDIRADIYSLGATFYFCLTGRTPFSEGTVAQKLIWHQTRQPKAIRTIRPDVPEAVVAIIDKMMAKDPAQRYQTPAAVAEALAPLTQTPIPPPPEAEMPQLSPAAMATVPGDPTQAATRTGAEQSPAPRRNWQVPTAPAPAASRPAVSPGPPTPAPAPPPRRDDPSLPALSAPTTPAAPLPAAPAGVLNNGQPAAPAAAAAPEVADEPASWDQLAPETAAPLGRADTDPSSRRRRPAPRRKLTEPPTVPLGRDRRFWLLVGGGTAVAAVALAFGLIALRRSGPPAPPPGPAAPRTTTVVVDPGGGEGYPTIAAALRSPRSGPLTIRVRGDLVEPDVYALNLRDVTIESESGASWTWRLPARSGPEVSLLRIAGCEGFTLRNCTLDGAGRADILVKMFSRCPGTTLENLRFTGFKQYGLHVSNCEGTADRPVTLRNLRFVTTDAKQAGLFFTAFSTNPSVKENQHIAVTDCTAEGPGKLAATSKPEHTAGVQFQPPLKPDVLP